MAERDCVNTYVAEQIKKRRKLLGISQKVLATHLGITFQQVQKYENGISKISVGRLYEIGKLLHTDISSFFSGFVDQQSCELMEEKNKYNHEDFRVILAQNIDKDLKILVNRYTKIQDPILRKKLIGLVKQIAG